MLGQDVIVPEVHGYTAITHAAYILLALSLSVVTLQVVALNYFDNTVQCCKTFAMRMRIPSLRHREWFYWWSVDADRTIT